MFRIGDEVIVTKNEYSITTMGSIGKVVKTNDYHSLVHFTHITSQRYGKYDHGQPDDHYFIPNEHLAPYKLVDPQLAVITKIKEMEARRIKLKKAKAKKADDVVAPYF
jgi:hypothetical protein